MSEARLKIVKNEEKLYEVGILALQGDFELHTQALKKIGHDSLLVKTPDDLKHVKRLIIPGGESTTINKLIDLYKLRQPLREFGMKNPVWGTCAGLILLGKDAADERIETLGLIDIDSARNAYGRQINSFTGEGEVELNGKREKIQMVFIRAPKIRRIGKNVKKLGQLNGDIVMAREGHILVSAFHPELTDSTLIHEYFLTLKT